LTAQSQALGARAGNNTPVAAALDMLNGDMLSKSADISRQMLTDAGGTAAQIANFTKNVNTTNNDTQTQNLQTVQQNQQLATQLLNSVLGTTTNQTDQINQAVTGASTTNQTQATSGTTNQNTAQTGTTNQAQTTAATSNQAQQTAQNSTQNVAGTTAQNATTNQNQQVQANQHSQQSQTINKSVAAALGGMLAAGVGINEVLKIATGKGFTGNAAQLIQYLKGATSDLGGNSNYGNEGYGSTPTGDIGTTGSFNGSNWFDQWQASLNPAVTAPSANFGDDWWMNPDIDWEGGGFADGGHINVPNLMTVNPLIKGGNKGGMPLGAVMDLLDSLGMNGSSSSGSSSGGSSSGGSASVGGAELGGIAPANNSGPTMGILPSLDGQPAKAVEEEAKPEEAPFGTATGEKIPPPQAVSGLASAAIGVGLGAIGINPILGMILKPFISSGINEVLGSNVKKVNEVNVTDPRKIDREPFEKDSVTGVEPIDAGNFPDIPNMQETVRDSLPDNVPPIDLSNWADSSGPMTGLGPINIPDIEPLPEVNWPAPEASSGGGNTDFSNPAYEHYFSNDFGGGFGDYGGGSYGGSFGGWAGSDFGGGGGGGGGGSHWDHFTEMSLAADGGLQTDPNKLTELDYKAPVEDDGGKADLMEALGICEDEEGIHFSAKSKNLLLRSLGSPKKMPAKPPGLNDGGKIVGPGTGISDSIPAKGPNGPLRVANGEYIISKDVVDKVGVGFFDELQRKFHVPADMQRAIMGDK
jgi:hypothetical protein